jgi:hypothetical protein
MIARLTVAACLVLLSAAPRAEEPSGCDKFLWNIAQEQALLTSPAETSRTDPRDRQMAKAIALDLKPISDADLPLPPERAPRVTNSFASAVSFGPATSRGIFRVSLSAAAWIDVIQKGAYVKSGRFTGAVGCPGIRKSVEFDIGPEPFTVQISGANSPKITFVLTPSPSDGP